VEENQIEPWSKINSFNFRISENQGSECIIGISFSADEPSCAIVWGRSFFTKIDFSKPVEKVNIKKNITSFKPLVCLEKLGKNKIILLEAPWIKIMKGFPPVLFRKKYGAAT
jgi:hypothetical protein